uniref:Endonuclease/exonuclease/phosphatase domain-containing protein n=1 Tax=Caenorhabditis japonica TaxID=281687 RepID=A0A8R1E763_CAEJA
MTRTVFVVRNLEVVRIRYQQDQEPNVWEEDSAQDVDDDVSSPPCRVDAAQIQQNSDNFPSHSTFSLFSTQSFPPPPPSTSFKFLLANLRGSASLSKIYALINFFISSNLDVLLLTETFFSDSVPISLLSSPHFTCHRFDRILSVHPKSSG